MAASLEEVLEALHSYANHNKRIPIATIDWIRDALAKGEHANLLTPPLTGTVLYRGDHTTIEVLAKDLGRPLEVGPKGSTQEVLHLIPGSSWSKSLDQATYHAMGSASYPVEVVYEAKGSEGWLDFRLLYKLSGFRGLRSEEEVLCLRKSVHCTANWEPNYYKYER